MYGSRDPSFFEHFRGLLELERKEERARLQEERATLPLAELEERGRVLLDLEAADESVGLGGRFLVKLEHRERRRLKAALSPGDLAEVRPRKSAEVEPAAAVVSRAGPTWVELAFERAPPPFVREGRLRVDVAHNDATFERAKGALARIQAMDKGQARHKREVLLGNTPPRFGRKVAPPPPGSALNPEQAEAVARALAAEDFFLVHGPPGTGKSTVLAEIASRAVGRGDRLLCTAPSNAAVDHLLELCLGQGLRALRVGHPARVAAHLQAHTLDLVVEEHPDRKLSLELFDEAHALLGYARRQRTQGRSRQRFANARESSAEARRLLDEARALERRAVAAVLTGAQVVCATLSGLEGHVLRQEAFDLALLDEATQALEPLSLLAFLKAEAVVLAGDHRQLSGTVLSREALAGGLGKSLFERLLEDQGEGVKKMLREQYRMSEAILAFPSRELYGGELRAHPSVAKRTLAEVLGPGAIVDAPPLLFLDTAGKGFDDELAPGSASHRNEGEAQLAAARAKELLEAGLAPHELAVIAPYRAQVARLRELIAEPLVEVDTVDAFQGREKDAVLLSLTRSNGEGALGFLLDLRRMNVAMTRPRRHLFVVGDSATLAGSPFYQRFLDEVQAQGGYRSVWEWPEGGVR